MHIRYITLILLIGCTETDGPCMSGWDSEQITLDDVDTIGPGYAASDVLDAVEGSYTIPIEWSEESGQTGDDLVELTVSYTGGPITWEHYLEPADWPEDLGPCNTDSLNIEVDVTLDSADGSFAESFTTELSHTTFSSGGYKASLGGDWAEGELNGSYEPPVDWDDYENDGVFFNASFLDSRYTGQISWMGDPLDDDQESYDFLDITEWEVELD
jgi:hypothetical protein